MRAWVVILAAAAGTYGLRASLILFFSRRDLPPVLERAFRHVAPAVLAALAVPTFVAPQGTLTLVPSHLAAGVVGGLTAWRTRSLPATLVAGLAAYGLVALIV